MKANKQCPKCSSLKIGYLEDVMDLGPPFYSPGVRRPLRTVEAFICADCGYFETYLASPGTVPFEELPGFRWLNPEQHRPYR